MRREITGMALGDILRGRGVLLGWGGGGAKVSGLQRDYGGLGGRRRVLLGDRGGGSRGNMAGVAFVDILPGRGVITAWLW